LENCLKNKIIIEYKMNNKFIIVMLNLFYLAVSARIFGFEYIIGKSKNLGHPDAHGCVMPYRYCNYTSSCEPFNKLCMLTN
jgi:hypothetical protein